MLSVELDPWGEFGELRAVLYDRHVEKRGESSGRTTSGGERAPAPSPVKSPRKHIGPAAPQLEEKENPWIDGANPRGFCFLPSCF